MYRTTYLPVSGLQCGYSTPVETQVNSCNISQPTTTNTTFPLRGSLTFNAEGVSDPSSRYFTGRLHHPTLSSGVTVGRGYDMRERNYKEVFSDLLCCGLSPMQAALFSRGAGLSGESARNFVVNYSGDSEIPSDVEQRLFSLEYGRMESDVERICSKPDVVAKYGSADWENMNPAIRELIVDLRYRGDYTPTSRLVVQNAVVNNDLESLTDIMSNREYWPSVPQDRFNRRMQFMQEALSQSQDSQELPVVEDAISTDTVDTVNDDTYLY